MVSQKYFWLLFSVFIFNLIKLFKLTSPLRKVGIEYDFWEASWASLLWSGILLHLRSYSGCLVVVVWQILIQRLQILMQRQGVGSCPENFRMRPWLYMKQEYYIRKNASPQRYFWRKKRTSSASHVMGVSTLVTPSHRFWWQPLTWKESYETVTCVPSGFPVWLQCNSPYSVWTVRFVGCEFSARRNIFRMYSNNF